MTLQTGTGIMGGPRRWDILASFMLEMGLKSFVEVGCKEGRTTGHILANVPDSRVIAIDPWCQQLPSAHDKTRETYEEWEFDKIEREFWVNVGEHRARCTMLRETSEAVAKGHAFLTPGDVDLIFIDALHDYESVKQDIALWWPKVRIGGILSGHDFNHRWPGCERAVAESFDLMQVGVAPDSVWFVVKTSEDQFRG